MPLKVLDPNVCMSKYREDVLKIVSKEEIKSTNQILLELQTRVNKAVNWHLLYRVLRDLEEEGKVEKLKARAGFFWRRK